MALRSQKKEDPLASVSDLMSGLMIIFLFIAVANMLGVKEEAMKSKIGEQRALESEKLAKDIAQKNEEMAKKLLEEKQNSEKIAAMYKSAAKRLMDEQQRIKIGEQRALESEKLAKDIAQKNEEMAKKLFEEKQNSEKIAAMHKSVAKRLMDGQQRIKQIAVTYDENQTKLYEALHREFPDRELENWSATIDKKTLSIRFFAPEVLFETGQAEVTPKFKDVLNVFFPRYLKILNSKQFRDSIAEIRIEGHTSSEWGEGDYSDDECYFKNMKLSQERTRSVLEYCYGIPDEHIDKVFMKRYLTANGLSSSKLVYNNHGIEDKHKSRRVEFRTVTNSTEQIIQILEELKVNND